jgi:GT2 family glycosyltransferase
MNPPRLSVIIPTHKRAEILNRTLSALACQTLPAAEFEVVVVADACQDDTVAQVACSIPKMPYRLHLFCHSARSAAATRNFGAALARGDILLFLDDDVVPQPELVQAHLLAAGQDRVNLGYSKPRLSERPSWWQQNARLWWEDTFRAMRLPGYRFSYRDFFSGNVSMEAELIHRVGGFDLDFKGRLEDYELGMRFLKAGSRFSFLPEAVGIHYDRTDLALWLSRIRQEGVADVQTGQRHPELRYGLFGDFEGVYGPWRIARKTIRNAAFRARPSGDRLASVLLRLADRCERLRLRGPWLQVTGALREYNYWRGVSETIGGRRALAAWLQEAPVQPALAADAPSVDLGSLPPEGLLQDLLAQGSERGLRLAVHGVEVLKLSPRPGFEPLRKEHLHRLLREHARQNFVPALALQWIRATPGRDLTCLLNSMKSI